MVKTRNNLSTSQIIPKKKIQRLRKIPKPVNNVKSTGVDLYNVDPADTSTVVDQFAKDSEAAILNNIAALNSQDLPLSLDSSPKDNEFRECLAIEVNNNTEHAKTQLIDFAARALSKANTFQDTINAGLAPQATTGTYPRQGSGEIPCRSNESEPQERGSAKDNGSPAKADVSILALGTDKTQPIPLIRNEDDSSTSLKRKRLSRGHMTKSVKESNKSSNGSSKCSHRYPRRKEPIRYVIHSESFWTECQKNALDQLQVLTNAHSELCMKDGVRLAKRKNGELDGDKVALKKRRLLIQNQRDTIEQAFEDIESWADQEKQITRRLENMK